MNDPTDFLIGHAAARAFPGYVPSYAVGRNPIDNPIADATARVHGQIPDNAAQLAGKFLPADPLNPVEPQGTVGHLPGFGDGGRVAFATRLAKLLEQLTDESAARSAANVDKTITRPRLPLAQGQEDPLVTAATTAPAAPPATQSPLQPGFLLRKQGMAEGGSPDDTTSSLQRLAERARALGGPYAARLATGVAKQFYGLDAQGNPVLGGGAWTDSQGGTPAGVLDTLAATPRHLVDLLSAIGGLGGPEPADVRAQPGHPQAIPTPQWSRDAADRLDALDHRVQAATGIGAPQTLPEHLTDAAAALATPIPASGAFKEAPLARRLLELLTPVRPTSAGRYATDTAFLGSASAGLDALGRRLAARPTRAAPAAADPQFEQAAIDATNAGSN